MRNAEAKNDLVGIANAYFGLGLVMYNLGNFDEGLMYFNKSKKGFLNAKDTSSTKVLNYLIGLSHFQINNLSKSESYLKAVNDDATLRLDSGRMFESKLYLLNIESQQKPSVSLLNEYEKVLGYYIRNSEKVGECHTRD